MFNKTVLLSLMLLLASGAVDAAPAAKRCSITARQNDQGQPPEGQPDMGQQPEGQPDQGAQPDAVQTEVQQPDAQQPGQQQGDFQQGGAQQPGAQQGDAQQPGAQQAPTQPKTKVNATGGGGGGGGGSRGKRGFSFPAQEPNGDPLAQFFENGSKVSWFYNWAKAYKWMAGTENVQGEFVPMVHNANSLYEGTNEGADPKTIFPEGTNLVLGFNEPDNKNPETGSGMDPGQAVELWKKMVDVGRAANPNMQFASPVVAGDKGWLQQFFSGLCPGGLTGCDYAPQYLGVHDYNTDPQTFINNVEGFHNDYPDLPIIVSEFACASFGGEQPSQEQVNTYMDTVIPWLDKTDYIHSYAWFTATRDPGKLYGVSPFNTLLDPNGGLTDLGRKYLTM